MPKAPAALTTTAPVGQGPLNVNINATTAQELRRIAARSGITYTEAVRRAVAVLDLLNEEIDAGKVIRTCKRNGRGVQEIYLIR